MNKDPIKSMAKALPSSVCVVTTNTEGRPAGFTASSLSFISMDPPLVQVSIMKEASSLGAFQRAEFFGVSILGSDRPDIALTFASRCDRFAKVDWAADANGVPQLADAACRVSLKSYYWLEMGDHFILYGEVVSIGNPAGKPFLGYAAGTFFCPTRGELV